MVHVSTVILLMLHFIMNSWPPHLAFTMIPCMFAAHQSSKTNIVQTCVIIGGDPGKYARPRSDDGPRASFSSSAPSLSPSLAPSLSPSSIPAELIVLDIIAETRGSGSGCGAVVRHVLTFADGCAPLCTDGACV